MSLLKSASTSGLSRREPLRVRARPDEALLLAGPQREDQRRVELEAAVGEHARQLHRQRRAAAVVVGARRVDVVVLVGTQLRVGGGLAGGARVGADLARVAEVDRVVVRRDVDPARRSCPAAPP